MSATGAEVPDVPQDGTQDRTQDGTQVGARVELRLPAESAYAAVLRTTTASLAARLDFTIDDIEDLRMAVGEAHAMVLEQSQPRSDVLCTFALSPGSMRVEVSVLSASGVPDLQSFAWQVLTTLAEEADVDALGERFTVSLTMSSSVVAPGTGAGA